MMIASLLFFLSFVLAYAWEEGNQAHVEEYIVYAATHEGVPVSLVLGIVRGESGFNKDADNPKSTASGLFQFLNSTFEEYCIKKYHIAPDMSYKDNPFMQTTCAIEMLKQPKGYMHWWESRESWGRFLAKK